MPVTKHLFAAPAGLLVTVASTFRVHGTVGATRFPFPVGEAASALDRVRERVLRMPEIIESKALSDMQYSSTPFRLLRLGPNVFVVYTG